MTREHESAAAPAIVLGLSPTGLGVARSLGRSGVPVYGIDPDPRAIGRHSRYCTYCEGLSRRVAAGDAPGLVSGLRDLAGRAPGPPVLFPTTDALIEMLVPIADELTSFARLSTDLGRFGLDFLSKRRFYDLCRRNGVELPATAFLGGERDLPAVREVARYPAILKPVFVHRFRSLLGSKKVVRVASGSELEDAYARLAPVDPHFILQEVIPGGDDRLWLSMCHTTGEGRVIGMFVGRKLRQYPPGFGSACLAESRWNPVVSDHTETFLSRVGFRGLCSTEFKEDPRDGRLKMIEVNARAPLWVSLTEAAGVNTAYACYADLVGAGCGPMEQTDGVRWVFAAKDVSSAVHEVRAGTLGFSGWRDSLRGCRAEAVWTRDDPAPAMHLPFYVAFKGCRRVWKAAGRRLTAR